MSSYPWPPVRRSDDDDPGARARFLTPRRLDFAPDAAVRAGRTMAAPPPAPRRGRRPGPAAAPSDRQHLWIPLGPVTVIEGQATGSPRVAGRVKAIDVHPEGERIYAASANGGVWYSGDGAATWQSLGGFAPTNVGEITRPAHRHACGAIFVDWGTTAAGDSVYVGTGEASHQYTAQPGSSLGGVGILVSHNPVGSTLTDPWTREAPNLLGKGVNRIVMEPGGAAIVAATSTGLRSRPVPADPEADWELVAGDPFDGLETMVSDVLWTEGGGTRPARLWVWVQGGPKAGLWVRADGEADFKRIDTPGFAKKRGVLAAATPPDTVYVLNDRHHKDAAQAQLPAMFRVSAAGNATPTASRVSVVPDVLGRQGFYDMAIAVDPTDATRVVIAGSTFDTTTPGGTAVSGDGGILAGEVGTTGTGLLMFGPTTSPDMIGIGVHADVHDLAFSNDGNRLWTSCDGGVYRSDDPAAIAGFRACNDGLSIVESNYVASHPTCEGYVVTGLQDNGIIERASTGVWRHTGDGDGGGVAFDPLQPDRFVRQYHNGSWVVSDGSADDSPLSRGGAVPSAADDEAGKLSAFYSTMAAVRHVRPGIPPTPEGQLLIGTNRPWFSRDMGTSWVTLPTGTDPLAGSYNASQDAFGEAITVCKWQSDDVAWLLGEGRLERLSRVPGSTVDGSIGTWNSPRTQIIRKGVKNKKDATSAEGPIRDAAVWTDIAVNLEPDDGSDPDSFGQQRGAKGAVYMGTSGHPTNEDVDTLWWFDGDETWHPTGLRNHARGVKAPVTAIACDPAFPNEVYVGTTVGVWRGERTLNGTDPPTWDWQPRVNGLPEAAVEDLSLFDSGGLRLLRAGIAARGVWELRLDVADVIDRTYVRVHDDDLRYRVDAVTTARDGTTTRSWHGSPDVRPREAPRDIPPPGSLPWSSAAGVGTQPNEQLRRFQAALRAQTGDLRCRATGVWDAYFEEVLRDNGAPVAAGKVSIDDGFWNATLEAPDATAEPWSTPIPAEVDLYDLTAPLVEGTLAAVSCGLPARPAKVDVVVHHRGLDPLDGSGLRVTLLQWRDPRARNRAKHDDVTTWPIAGAVDVPWAGAVNDVLNSAGATTAVSLAGTGWSFVGSNAAARRKTLAGQTLHNERSGVATFDLDLTGVRVDRVIVLAAVIRDADPSAIPAMPLRELALSNHRVAVRSLKIGTI